MIEIGGQRTQPRPNDKYWRLFLGDQLCDPWNEKTNTYQRHRWLWSSYGNYGTHGNNYYVQCRVQEMKSGAWNATVKRNEGVSWNHSYALKLSHDGKLSMFELYPGQCNHLKTSYYVEEFGC